MAVLGIDPGKLGGIACLASNGDVLGSLKLENSSETDVREWVCDIQRDSTLNRIFLERATSSSQMGRGSAFAFGLNYGFLRGLLIGSCLKFEEVQPATWQRAFSLIARGSTKLGDDSKRAAEKKRRNKAKAQQLFPGEKVTNWLADALLIAEYARRQP